MSEYKRESNKSPYLNTGTNKRILIGIAVLLLAAVGTAAALTAQEQLGRNLFFDTNLSTPQGQGCVSCHDPAFAFSDPDNSTGVSHGVNTTRFGSRNAPTAMYQAFTPDFGFFGGEFTGGQFWDQRAANLTEQAKGPFLNPLEMNNPSNVTVLNKIQNSGYKTLFNQVCGQPDTGNQSDVELKYTCMAEAIAAFESTPELNKFSSKFDLYPEAMTVQEKRGLLLFRGKGGCAVCHPLSPIPSRSVFTDTDAHNIGVPSNLGMLGDSQALQAYFPFYYPPLVPGFNPAGLNFVDVGLAGNPNIPLVMQPAMKGAFKVPTLRNVALTAPYMHNGVFRDLKTVVHFYNTRDALGHCASTQNPRPGVNCWPGPEVPVNLAPGIGNLELTDAEENDIVAFLLTLTDGYVPSNITPALTTKEQLGKKLFSDTNLSTPAGQACQSCHVPSVAFTGPDKNRSVSEGATPGRFGSRNAPSTAYAAFSPDFVLFGAGFMGGQFWDQRAANLTEQAKGPFLNKLEMNNTDPAEVLNKINNSTYKDIFNNVCGNQSYPDGQYTCIASSIAAFENTPEMNRFSSKFDLDQANMTLDEMKGFKLFAGKGKCILCHPLGPTPSSTLFTDFDAENTGIPSNLGMLGNTTNLIYYFPFYYLAPEFNPAGPNFVDIGLAGNPNVPAVMQPLVKGAFKAPTLRNVGLTDPYMHNGVFRDLKTVVHFYNTRDVLGSCEIRTNPQPGVNCWPAPEVLPNMNTAIGNLQLTDAEENEIVAFLKTLTDGYVPQQGTSVPTPQEQLGKNLFSDTNLSTPQGQACQSCHVPSVGFTDPHKDRAVSEGAVPGRFGSRNAPSSAYKAFAPDFSLVGAGFIGGQLWDQRVANLTEQAKGPFLVAVEMNNPDKATVLNKIKTASYAPLFTTVCTQQDVESQYTCMASAIAAFEKTPELNSFSSKFDLDQANLTVQEMRGFNLFNGKGTCVVCHPMAPFGSRSLFTDFDAENIGVPKNLGMMGDTPALKYYYPFYYLPEFNPAGLNFIDVGVAGNPNVPATLQPTLKGAMKAPSLRNVGLTAPYMHNGVFRTLKEVVHFYNTRDTLGNCAVRTDPQPGVNCWPAPEVAANLALGVGNLQLTDAEENDIVAFLLTLTDGYSSQQGGNIIGGVINNATGAPIRTAVVTAGTRTALADARGSYTIMNIAPGTYTVTASAIGFNPISATVSVSSRANAVQDFSLQPAQGEVIANITGFSAGNGGSWINASVNVTNTGSVSRFYVIEVSGVSQQGYPLAGIGTLRLAAGESVNNVPVLIVKPQLTHVGSYNLTARIWGLDEYPALDRLIMAIGPIIVNLIQDTIPPIINSIALSNTTPTAGSSILVTVNATDNVAVTAVTANGVSLTSRGGNIWNGSITALLGINPVNVSASDAAGNVAWNNATSYTATAPLTFLKSIGISPSAAMLIAGENLVFNATAKDQNSAPMAGINISWTISDPAIGTVTPLSAITGADGIASTTFTALAVGAAMINATNDNIVGSASVTVSAQAHGQPLIPAGYYGNITVNGQPASPGTKIFAKIGAEERGNITTTASGAYGGSEGPSPKLWVKGFQGENGATVTFYVGSVAAQQTATWISGEIKQVDLTFVGVPALTIITVSPATATLSIGGTKLLTATAKDQNGIPMQGIIISWISSNTNVGSIAPLNGITGADGNASATFTAVGAGTASITASNGTVAGSAVVTVAAGEAEKGGAGEVSRSGGGTGGGSITSAEPSDNIERAYRTEKDLIANVSVIFSFPPGEGGIYEIAVVGKENENDVAIRVEHLKGLSKLLKEPAPGTVYYYVNIWSSTERIKEALIRFKVQNSWLDSNNIGNNDVKILKWDGSKWVQLNLAQIKKDSTHTYFEAKTDTFSHFAVSGVKGAVSAPPAVTPAKQVTPVPPVVPIEKAQGFGIIAIAILAAIALLAVYLWKVRR